MSADVLFGMIALFYCAFCIVFSVIYICVKSTLPSRTELMRQSAENRVLLERARRKNASKRETL